MVVRSLSERFQDRYTPDPNSGCWLWIGSQWKRGYGAFYLGNNEYQLAHRFSYELHKGPIPNDHEIDHLCRVHSCVNPAHLEAVSHRVNVIRGNDTRPVRRFCRRGHRKSYKGYAGQMRCLECHAKQQRAYLSRRLPS